jgi:hypothetical protein
MRFTKWKNSILMLRLQTVVLCGEVSEWPIVHPWKGCVPQGTKGSNPFLSARSYYFGILKSSITRKTLPMASRIKTRSPLWAVFFKACNSLK